MTARFFIIRGCFILSWYGYRFMANSLIDRRIFLKVDFMLIFALISLTLGLILSFTKENLAKIELALGLALVGFSLGIWGIFESLSPFVRLLHNDLYFALKAVSSLFFGLLILFLYIKSLKELTGKIFKLKF